MTESTLESPGNGETPDTAALTPPPGSPEPPVRESDPEPDLGANWTTVRDYVQRAADDDALIDAGRLGVLMDQLANPPRSEATVA